MPLRFSTGLRNALNSKACSQTKVVDGETGIAFSDVDNSVGATYTKGAIQVGDLIKIEGCTDTAANNGFYTVATVGANTFTTNEAITTQSDETGAVDIYVITGGSFKDTFRNGVLVLYSGTQPGSADDAEAGTPLLKVTLSSGGHSGGSPGNGLNFGTSSSGIVGKIAADVWSGLGLTGGTAGWFRFFDNNHTTGSSTTSVRFDGTCATSGGQLNMSSTSIVQDATTTVDSFNVTLMSSTV